MNTDTTREIRIPPIIVKNLNVNKAGRAFKDLGLKLRITNVNRHTSKLYTNNKRERDIVKELLLKKGVEFYTYSSKDERPVSILLKGLHETIEENSGEQECSEPVKR